MARRASSAGRQALTALAFLFMAVPSRAQARAKDCLSGAWVLGDQRAISPRSAMPSSRACPCDLAAGRRPAYQRWTRRAIEDRIRLLRAIEGLDGGQIV